MELYFATVRAEGAEVRRYVMMPSTMLISLQASLQDQPKEALDFVRTWPSLDKLPGSLVRSATRMVEIVGRLCCEEAIGLCSPCDEIPTQIHLRWKAPGDLRGQVSGQKGL